MSLRRSSSGDLRPSSRNPTVSKTSKRPESGKSLRSNKSTSSRNSSVSDLLNVSPASTTKRTGGHVKGNSLKSVPVTDLRNSDKSRVKDKPGKRSKNGPVTSTARPAWAVKNFVESETPRSDVSTLSSLPARPSLDDFLNFRDVEPTSIYETESDLSQNNSNITQSSLLEYLTADTARTGYTSTETSRIGDTNRTRSTLNTDLNTERANNKSNYISDEKINIHKNENISDWGSQKNKSSKPSSKLSHSMSSKASNSVSLNKENNLKNEKSLTRKLSSGSKSTNNSTLSSSKSNINSKKSKLRVKNDKSYQAAYEKFGLLHNENIDSSIEADKMEMLNNRREIFAAKSIQRWWRKVLLRRRAGDAAMRRMMESKKNELEQRMSFEREQEYKKQVEEYEEMKRREEQERMIREEIINKMQTEREEKEKQNKRLKYMQPSGKVTKTAKSTTKKKPQKAFKSVDDFVKDQHEDNQRDLIRPTTSSSVARKVDEIFEHSSRESSQVNTARSHSSNEDEYMIGKQKIDLKESTNSYKSVHRESGTNASSKKTTLDDLFNSLKELEEEPIFSKSKQHGGFNADTQSNNFREAALTVGNIKKSHLEEEQEVAPGSYLSAHKLQNIMSFLDEVEKIEEEVRSEVMSSKDLYHSVAIPPEEASPEKDSVLESASQVANDISSAITAQKMEIDEKKRTVEMMKKAISQQKEFTTMQMREMDKEHKQQLTLQRQEYESTIQRHLSFIDQLIDDKKVLTQRCEELVGKLKEVDSKYSTKIKQMTESHALELKKQKEISEAAEKIRREKWIKEKTQEIKEMTVKGLEPDIQKLIAKHKAEIKKIKAMSQGEVLEADERVGRRFVQQMEDLRNHLEKEKDLAVKKEREIAREKFEIQLREEESSYQQQRRRLYQEIEAEKERCDQQLQQMKKEYDERRAAHEESSKQTVKVAQEDNQKQLQELKEKHQVDMKNYKEKLDLEREQWIENYMKKQETYLLTKERELKEGVREARDKEIEMVIARLEQETALGRDESEKAAENRIKRIRDKYENEIKEYELTEKSMQAKVSQLKETVEEKENECLRLKSENKQKTQELVDVKNLTDRLQEERGKVTDIIRQEFADRLVVLEEESKRLRNELSEEKARHKFDVDRVNKDKEEELEEVHKRVKKAIAKKEETTQMLRQQMLAAEKRAEHLEQLLAEQRKKILSK